MPEGSALRYDRLVHEAGGLAASHRWLVERVPRGSTVLDCGCAGGLTARALSEERGCVVDGAEVSAEAAETAREACRQVYVGSLEDPAFVGSLGSGYDRIVFGDVLEHLADPAAVLELVRGRLAPEGRILISVPNVAYWRMRIHLLFGRFRYRDSGLLDRTHLRFYTWHGGRRLVEGAGYRVVRHEMTCRVPRVPGVHAVLCALARLRPNLFGYQTLIEAEPWRG